MDSEKVVSPTDAMASAFLARVIASALVDYLRAEGVIDPAKFEEYLRAAALTLADNSAEPLAGIYRRLSEGWDGPAAP